MVSILAHSMVSSLGWDPALACAAARAGLVRARLLDGTRVSAGPDGRPEPVVAHGVPLLTQGFEGEARLQRLVDQALENLLDSCPVLREQPDGVGFYLAVPDPSRDTQGVDLITANTVREELSEAAQVWAQYPFNGDLTQRLLTRASAAVGWPGSIGFQRTSAAGHAAPLALMAAARQDLLAGKVRTAVVGAVDSLLSPSTLAWLHQCHRLKTKAMPIGLMPGEGCVFVVLSLPSTWPAVPPQGHLLDVALGQEPMSLLSGATSVGEALASVMTRLATAAHWQEETASWVLSDHNGEVYRANEWGHALVRLQGAWPAAATPTVWYPAMSFGDTGTASGLIAVCQALHAYARAYAPAPHAMVLASSEGTERAGLVLSAPIGSGHFAARGAGA